jgi:hypothetical protein
VSGGTQQFIAQSLFGKFGKFVKAAMKQNFKMIGKFRIYVICKTFILAAVHLLA